MQLAIRKLFLSSERNDKGGHTDPIQTV